MTEQSAPAASVMQMHVGPLDQRGVVRVDGADAEDFLQGLVTNDVTGIADGAGRYAALLTPQGKILFDFLVTRARDGAFLLDVPRSMAADLVRRLGFYKLRANVAIEDRSETLGVSAAWGDGAEAWIDAGSAPNALAAFADPRHPALGWRTVAPTDSELPAPPGADYAAHRIALGIPEGGFDFVYGDTFPHEANLDRLHGVDFRKGCYVGQEVVSRVEHRGSARKRIVPVSFEGRGPGRGAEVFAGDVSLGHMGSSAAGRGLAMLRLDRVEEAHKLGVPIIAGRTPLTVAAGAV